MQLDIVFQNRFKFFLCSQAGIPVNVPRHTLANHLIYQNNSEEEIRQVLGHSTIATTKIYLRERHGFSGAFDIMKRFHERNN